MHLECKNVQKASLCFIKDAIEDKYIASLLNPYTNFFKDDIPAAIECLNYNCGKVRHKEVAQKEIEVMLMS